MVEEQERQSIIDSEHLRLLSLAYVIEGATYVLFSVFGLFYAFIGVFIGADFARMPPQQGQPPPPFFGWIFGFIGLTMFGLFVAFGALKLLCAHRLWHRRSRILCIVIAALSCFAVPYGTAIGVWTFMVLARPSVNRLFEASASSGPNRPPAVGRSGA